MKVTAEARAAARAARYGEPTDTYTWGRCPGSGWAIKIVGGQQ